MKSPGRTISIRYKVLFVLTSLPVITLATYLFLAVSVFKDDKIAYVFDASSAVSRTMSAQVRAEMNGLLNLMKPMIQDFALKGTLTEVSHTVFDNEPNFELFLVMKSDQGHWVPEQNLAKSPELPEQLRSHPEFQAWLQVADREGRVVRNPFGDDRIVILEKAQQEDRKWIFAEMVRSREFADVFRTASTYKTYLVDSSGQLIFGPTGPGQGQEFVPTEFVKNAAASQFVSGTESVKIGKTLDLLASYAKVGFADLMVTSFVEKSVALSAVEILIQKSLLFFGMLISVTVILSLAASRGLTSSLTKLFTATKSVAEGNFDIRVNVSSNDEIGSLATSFNRMAEEVKRLLMETAEKARMQNELQTAQTVQETLFPPPLAKIKGLEIAGYYTPASECGGDWWHYCEVGKKVYLWIGDATGHGAPAALITAAAKSAATIIERLGVGPSQALGLLNRAIADVSKGKIMMTFFLASYDTETHELTFSNASHEPPMLIKRGALPLKKKDMIVLNDVNSTRLGQNREASFEEAKVQLDPGDSVLFYTDGIPDLENPQKESLGERAFLKWVVEVNTDYPTAEKSVADMVTKIKTYRQDAPLKDDITFFMIRRGEG